MPNLGCPFEVFVVATRPYAEKCCAMRRNRDDSNGGFWLIREEAEKACGRMNLDYPSEVKVWKVYRALITIDKSS